MARAPVLNYDSPQSQETIMKIVAYLLGRPLYGATQQQIADMLEVSVQTANRFIQHLLAKEKIHIWIKAQAQGRKSPAVYKHGPKFVTPCYGRRYTDLPLAFFGGIERRKTKRIMNFNDGKNEVTAAASPMTPWFYIHDENEGDPVRQGPYECMFLGPLAEEGKTHMRWFDGRHWSFPLQPEHEREDGFVKPHDSLFITDRELLPRFAWRGFREDQEPL